jgi:asparagine synthase (glutamine-hydrolysing)
MCGIAGMILGRGSVKGAELSGLLKLLKHRGPDGEGKHIDDAVGLAHTRLAIIDLVSGQQPLYSRDKNLCLIANGEIYNYLELRDELQSKGYVFTTNSDCEPLLYAYEEYGTDFLKRIEGMFALVLYDHSRKRLLLARDRLGIKPLYISRTDKGLFFGSELKALFHMTGGVPPLDPASLVQYLQNNFTTGRRTICKGIERILPGEVMLVDEHLNIQRWGYWSVEDITTEPWDFDDACREFDTLMSDIIIKHLRSDVPIGLYLSGGIDSSVLLALLKEHSRYTPSTYSIGFASDSVKSELSHAKAAAERFGSQHFEFTVESSDLFNRIAHSVWCSDDLMGDYANLPVSLLSEQVSKHIKVVFSGEGGDEVFAGYGRYRKSRAQRFLKNLIKPGSGGFRVKPHFPKNLSDRLFGPALKTVAHSWRDPFIEMWKLSPSSWSDLQRMQYVDLKTWLPDDLLVKADRMMMAWGLEGRVPFLDHRMVEFGLKLPDGLKISRNNGKLFLRRWAERHFPVEHLQGRKRGFTVPVTDWFTREYLAVLSEALTGSEVVRQWFEPEGIRWLLEEQKRTGRYYQHLFRILQLATWHRIFVENGGTMPPRSIHPARLLK